MFDRTAALGRLLLGLTLIPSALSATTPLRSLFSGPQLREGTLVPAGRSPFAGRMAPQLPDTLEISAFLVDFLPETPDNPPTTGDGTFGSDTTTKTPLEPWRARRDTTRAHYLRVFQGVSEYWRTASGGKLEVEFRVFPEAAGSKPYRLPRTIGQYSPPEKSATETQSSYDSGYVTRILEMIADATHKASSDATGPFAAPKPSSSHRHRSYLMVHAGATRSTDGGDKGPSAANTIADIGDFAVGPYDFKFLGDKRRVRDTAYLADSAGIALNSHDTLRELLVTAETASQDGLNWGIRGTVANLVGRALGLPDLYDTYRGLSVMGQFCLMDAAGAMGGRNSTPALPSAWPRLFLGWATPVEATVSGATKFRLPAIRPGHDTVLVVRLNDGEYLLVENRQRTEFDGKVWVKVGNLAGTDSTTYKVVPDSLDSLLKDDKRTKGYVLGSSPDAALPGSGLLVWHVNEWLLKTLVRSGAPNSYLGDTLTDRYKGITLVQASGKQTLGRLFQGITGQSSSDLGSGSDILPHARRHAGRTDTITAIGPEGYAATGTLLGGRSLVTLRAPWPTGSLPQTGKSSLEGDSVWTPGAAAIDITLDWGALRNSANVFPVRTTPAWGDQAILPGPASAPKSVWILDTTGRATLLDSTGRSWFTARDTAKWVTPWDSTPTAFANRPQLDTILVPFAKIGTTMARVAQSAILIDTLMVRDSHRGLHLKWPAPQAFLVANRDSARFLDTTLALRATAGPIATTKGFWVGDSAGNLVQATTQGTTASIATGLGHLQSICITIRNGKTLVAAVDSTGAASIVDPTGPTTLLRSAAFSPRLRENFQVLSTDFDRDGIADLAVIGSFGNAILWSGSTNAPLPGWPRVFARGSMDAGEPGPAALADLDGDGRPELVFAGGDRLFVIDASGIPAKGWPQRIEATESVGQATASRSYPAGMLGTSPLVADLNANGTSEVLLGTSNGQILGWQNSGDRYAGSALAATPGSGVAPSYQQASWPLAAGGQSLDSTRPPYLPIAFPSGRADRLLALSSLSSLDAFLIPGGQATWPLALGNGARSGYLPDSLLAPPKTREPGISEFILYPSPIRKGQATFRYQLGRDASRVRVTVYDQTGFQVLDRSDLATGAGRRDLALQNLAWGSGVYAARLEVKWDGGGTNEAWVRFGVIR